MLARKLIMAAGNAGGGGSYYIATLGDSGGTGSTQGHLSNGDFILFNSQWNTSGDYALLSIDGDGEINWGLFFNPTSSQTNWTRGLTVDSSDNIYLPASNVNTGATGSAIYKINSSGSTQAVYNINTLPVSTQYSGVSLQDGTNFYCVYPGGAGDMSASFSEPLSSFSGSPTWVLEVPGSAVKISGARVDGSYVTYAQLYGSGTGSLPGVFQINKSTGALSLNKLFYNDRTYKILSASRGILPVDSSGNYYFSWYQSGDAIYIDRVCVTKLNSSLSSLTWSKELDYTSLDSAMQDGFIVVDSNDNVHSVNKLKTGTNDFGILITTFNTSGTFQSELLVSHSYSGALNLFEGEISIDDNDDIYISYARYDRDILGFVREFMKLPSDYSSLGGTYGNWTVTYSTSSTVSITDITSVSSISGTTFGSNTASQTFSTGTDASSTLTTATTSVTTL